MADPRVSEAKLIKLADVVVRDRLRPVSEAGLAALISSIEATGHMTDDIHVRRVRKGKKTEFVLIAGGHRVEAAKRLGWTEIRAKIWECTADFARLMEADENLAKSDLSPLELATFLAARKAAYLKVYPETARGGDRKSVDFRKNQTELSSFCSSAAEKRCMTERQVRKYVAIGEALEPNIVKLLYTAETPPTLKMLTELTAVGDIERLPTTLQLVERGAKDVSEALRRVRKEPKPIKPQPDDAAYLKMQSAFDRGSKAAQRRHLLQVAQEHPELFAEIAATIAASDLEVAA